MWSHIALHVPHRLLFPILYDVIDKNEFVLDDLEPLMTLLKQSLSISTLDDLSTNYSLLKQLFLKLFTLRTIHTKKLPPNQMNIYEDHIFDCFSELVMRLSEETFRPLFYTIYEWAVYNEPPPEYTLTFYRLTFM
jgi:U3 small nucleolar RNA-associated protein 10